MRVSDFKLVNPKVERERLLAVLAGFNRTARDFDRDRTLHSVLEERAKAVPSRIAVRGDDDGLTYRELGEISGRIASWILTLPPRSPRVAGVLMENTPDMISAVLGTLRAGAIYLPINPELPLDRIAAMLNDTGAQILLTERKFAREGNRLQYECPSLTHLLCLDSPSFLEEEEPASELSRLDLWEYVGAQASDAISGGGWKNSYTGHYLSAEIMREYADNTYLKLSPHLRPESRVLEIGCSTGLTMFRLAPACGFYYGIDFSKTILEKTRAEARRLGIANIRLECLAAHDLDRIPESGFDLVILNSVAQNFNGHNYLRKVMFKAARLLNPEGRIFLGDLMDQDRKQALIDSLVQFQRENAGKSFSTKTDWSEELFLSRGWIEDLCLDLPGVTTACHSEKIYTIPNELTEFRFDSLITIHREEGAAETFGKRFRYQASRPQLEAHSPDPPPSEVTAEQPAYIMYTSGTTGRPKGVVVSHRSIHNYVQWAARYYFAEGGGDMALFTSPAFDLTLTSIFVPLYLGRSIRAFRNREIHQLLEEVFAAPVDAIKLTPSHISILDNCSLLPAALQVAIVGGEDLTVEQVHTLRRCAPGIRIYNEYGPTEATIGCTACLVEEPPIHVGKPIDNAEIWILGHDGELKPVGAPGELCVAGDGLASGYFGDPELTGQKFVPHPIHGSQGIYRTGDQARWMPDGNLVLLGRVDRQVKIRGNRIEPGEVESQLRKLPGVRDAAVLARMDARGDTVLCAYLIPNDGLDLDVTALRSALTRVLPDYLIPSYFAALTEFPLSLNGKLDRKRLPEPEAIARARAADYEAPGTDTEKALENIWREVLGVSRIGVNDNFFELGGHSLKATQVVSRVHRTLQASLELRQVFRHPALRDMAAAIDRARRFRFSAINPLPPAKDYELSHAQRRLWILHQMEPDSIAYNIHDGIEIEGALDVELLQTAFNTLVRRHESLRTIIVLTAEGPRQKIVDDIGFHALVTDLGMETDPEAAATRIALAEASTPFDLKRGPLLRVRLLRIDGDRHRLLMTMHHAVSDGWSAGVMVRELMHFYGSCRAGVPPTPPLRIQYKDYAAWQNLQLANAQDHARFWQKRLAGPLPILDLPTDFPRPDRQSFTGASVRFRVPGGLADALRRVAARERVSLFMVLNAALKATLFRLTGVEDVILGVPVAGRTHVDLEDQIGFFVNTLALRDEVRPYEGFRDLLSRIRRTTTEAFEHQAYPFDRLVNELNLDRDTSRSPLFDVMLVLHNNDQPQIAMEGLRVRPLQMDLPVSRFDLTFHFFEIEDGIAAAVEYSTALFREDRIRRVWACFERLMESAVSDVSLPIGELRIVPEGERELLKKGLHHTDAPWESPLAMFRSQVIRRPEQAAVVCGERCLTYRDLDRRSSELAVALGVPADGNNIVAVLLERSERNLTAMIACLKAGCAYLALDPSYPQERVSAILRDSRACAVVLDAGRPERLDGYAGRVVSFADPMPEADQAFQPREGHIAYVVYTSGSTGVPKGVAGTTQCLGNLISWQRRAVGDGMRVAQYAALGFDVSVQEMLYSACSGGTLYVPAEEERVDPARLRQFMQGWAIELMAMPFSGLNLPFSTQTGLECLQSLRHLITSGEQLHITPELRLFLDRRPDVRLHNQYGPSETHVVTSYTLAPGGLAAGELPPIGRPIANTRCYILDSHKEPVPIGIAGELFLAGAGVADGYLNDAELTARRFLADPFRPGERMYRTGDRCRWRADGEIEFLGRLDDQVKIRGYRVEPAEIEMALLSLPDVKAVCVTTWKTPGGQIELAAYYTGAAPLPEAVLRERLSRRLAPYMVPARFIYLAQMPLTSTGKVNRRALPAPATIAATRNELPGELLSPTAQHIASAFAAILERDGVGADEDFFHVGGHSLLAVQLATRLQNDFSQEVPLITIFQRPTVRKLSEWIDGIREYQQQHDGRHFAELNSSTGPPIFAMPPLLGYAMAFRRLAELMPEHRVCGFDFVERLELLKEYAAMIEARHPAGKVILFGYSGGGNLAFELAKRLESAGRSVTLILLDSFRLESASPQSDYQVQRSVRLNLEYFDRYLEQDPSMRVFVQNETVRAILTKKMSSYLRYLNTIDNRGVIRGDIHLVESNEFSGDPRRSDWETATSGSFVRYPGHGAHVEMILEKYVAQNAAILNRVLTLETLA